MGDDAPALRGLLWWSEIDEIRVNARLPGLRRPLRSMPPLLLSLLLAATSDQSGGAREVTARAFGQPADDARLGFIEPDERVPVDRM